MTKRFIRMAGLLALWPCLALSEGMNFQIKLMGEPEKKTGAAFYVPPPGMSILKDAKSDPKPEPEPEHSLYSPDDMTLLWNEVLMAFDGRTYQYRVQYFQDKEEAMRCQNGRVDVCFRRFTGGSRIGRSIEIKPQIRHVLKTLSPYRSSDVVFLPEENLWMRVELEAMMDRETIAEFATKIKRESWMAKYAPDALPALRELREDKGLEKRTLLFGIDSVEMLESALQRMPLTGSDLDAELPNGKTPLIWAIQLGDRGLMDALVKHGASWHHCSRYMCPLTTAIEENNLDLARYLLDAGVDPEQMSGVGLRPLVFAAEQGPEFVRLLLGRGAKPDLPADFVSPLMAAASVEGLEASELLLKAGADPLRTVDRPDFDGLRKTGVMNFTPGQNPQYDRWIKRVVDEAFGKTGKYDWDLWLEQDGKKLMPRDGQPVPLRRQPFRVMMSMAQPHRIVAMASKEKGLEQIMSSTRLLHDVLKPGRVGATSPDASWIGLESLAMEEGENGPVYTADVGTMDWTFNENPEEGRGTHEIPSSTGKRLFVYDVTEVLTGPGETTPVTGWTGEDIYLMVGLQPDSRRGSYLYRPRLLQLRFIGMSTTSAPAARKPAKKVH